MLFIKWNCSSSTQERGRERTVGGEDRIYSASGGSMTWLESSMTQVMNLQSTDLLTSWMNHFTEVKSRTNSWFDYAAAWLKIICVKNNKQLCGLHYCFYRLLIEIKEWLWWQDGVCYRWCLKKLGHCTNRGTKQINHSPTNKIWIKNEYANSRKQISLIFLFQSFDLILTTRWALSP